jgi:tryptophan halogenase
MPIPQSLEYKMKLFRDRGYVVKYKDGMFLDRSWQAVYLGQRIVPGDYDPLVETLDTDEIRRYVRSTKDTVRRVAETMPMHDAWLARHIRTATAQ